ncbi:MAG: ribonuclease J, partial [Clostridia bacterium]|nr:ribonuclease J [Clostridia bacterium]
SKLKMIPLGGLHEIGKNMTVFEYGNNIILVDCGSAFPDEDMPGIDLVIPDITYLKKNRDKIRGIVLTHGHEDHIGALPYVLQDINVPIYGTKLTLGIVEHKLKEFHLQDQVQLRVVSPGDRVHLECFDVEFIRSNHSIADAVALAIHTPVGVVIHTGDFKIDPTPIQGEMIDLTRFGELGREGVLALCADSTNVERPGYTMSEKTVGNSFRDIFKDCKKRIIIATFASNIHRVQQIIDAAAQNKRKVAISGRSMINVISVANELGYINIPANVLIELEEINRYPAHKIVLITTGSQGEEMSALTRMAFSDHKKVEITGNDLVVISANPIPGNEKLVSRVVNELFKKGAEVIYESSLAEVHVSGHACQEELKLIMALTKPKFFVPVHGEYRHLCIHKDLSKTMGIPEQNSFILDIGKVLEFTADSAKINGTVPSGKILVDGLGVGDVGNIVLRDRKHLAQDGLIVAVISLSGDNGEMILEPDIITRGFVYVRESEDLMEQMREVVRKSVLDSVNKKARDWNSLKSSVKNQLGQYIYDATKRSPMILPVIVEV